MDTKAEKRTADFVVNAKESPALVAILRHTSLRNEQVRDATDTSICPYLEQDANLHAM